MYSRFVFGKVDRKDLKDKEIHPYGVFKDPLNLKRGDLSELRWKSKLKIDQAKLVMKNSDPVADMVALVPRSNYTLPTPAFTLKHDYDESLLPWDHFPRSFNLNFLPIDPATGESLREYAFPYFSSYFQAKSQLIKLETRIDPFSHARSYNFSDYFRLPTDLPLDYYSPTDIPDLLTFIPGQTFTS